MFIVVYCFVVFLCCSSLGLFLFFGCYRIIGILGKDI